MRPTPGVTPALGGGPVAASRGWRAFGARGYLRRRRRCRHRVSAGARPTAPARSSACSATSRSATATRPRPSADRSSVPCSRILLLHAGEVVTTERLVDAIWGDEPPPTATAIVYGYVRKAPVGARGDLGDAEHPILRIRPRHPGRLARRRAVRAPGRARTAGAPCRRRRGCAPAARLGPRPVARRGARRARRRRVHPRRAAAPRFTAPRDAPGPDRRRSPPRRRGRRRGGARRAGARAPAGRGHPRPADGGALPDGQPGGGARRVPGHPPGACGGAGARPVAQPPGARGLRSCARIRRLDPPGPDAPPAPGPDGAPARQRRRSTSSKRGTACPFVGLATFGVNDADLFFGRERLVAEMVARLGRARLPRGRRPVRQRQVVGGASGARPGARGRRHRRDELGTGDPPAGRRAHARARSRRVRGPRRVAAVAAARPGRTRSSPPRRCCPRARDCW